MPAAWKAPWTASPGPPPRRLVWSSMLGRRCGIGDAVWAQFPSAGNWLSFVFCVEYLHQIEAQKGGGSCYTVSPSAQAQHPGGLRTLQCTPVIHVAGAAVFYSRFALGIFAPMCVSVPGSPFHQEVVDVVGKWLGAGVGLSRLAFLLGRFSLL